MLFSMYVPYIIRISSKKIPIKEALKERPARLLFGAKLGLRAIHGLLCGNYGCLYIIISIQRLLVY